jgi:hypothetical protein
LIEPAGKYVTGTCAVADKLGHLKERRNRLPHGTLCSQLARGLSL